MDPIQRPKHRAPGQARTAAHPHKFKPRHCAGTSCFHSHPGESTTRPSGIARTT